MVLFLTSSPCEPVIPGDVCGPAKFSEKYGFAYHLRRYWKEHMRCLVISSSPEDYEFTDRVFADMKQIIASSGLKLDAIHSWDHRTPMISKEQLHSYDLLLLSGGHVPTQNAFFERIHLREKIEGYEGIVMGISAGTMNCADIVYVQPELEGESIDPEFKRFRKGLGLTDLMILPHFNQVKDYMLDGRRLYEDITYADSIGHEFYVLEDESYIMIEDGVTTFHGNIRLLKDKKMSHWGRVSGSFTNYYDVK